LFSGFLIFKKVLIMANQDSPKLLKNAVDKVTESLQVFNNTNSKTHQEIFAEHNSTALPRVLGERMDISGAICDIKLKDVAALAIPNMVERCRETKKLDAKDIGSAKPYLNIAA
jgi:hypothetical protein